jgi:hypothetical protein
VPPAAGPPPADDGHRGERFRILSAIESALADPVRLLGILLDSEDDDDAIDRLMDAYGVDAVQAQAMLDLQFRRVIPANRARLADELRVLRAEWGPPVMAHIEFTGRRSAVLSIDGAEHSFRAGGVHGVLDKIRDFALDEVAVPTLRPVVASVAGLPEGPVRMTITPSRDGRYEYPDEPVALTGER